MRAPSNEPGHDPERYLADVFEQLTIATTREASVRTAMQAAHGLAGVDGLCLLSAAGEGCLVAVAEGQQVYTCDLRNSGLYRMVTPVLQADAAGSRTLWGKQDCVALPNGEQRRIEVVLIVPVARASGHAAVGFFWRPGQSADSQSARRLELLAKALGLAACTWQRKQEHAASQRDQHRISAELQHRLRNNLALMRSIVRRSHETAESSEHFALHLEARIGALARMQGALAAHGEDGMDLEEIIRTELMASAVPERGYVVQGPALRLHAKAAESVALAIHELATNSVKFGAFAVPSGQLEVAWAVTGGQVPRLHFSWIESGVTIVAVAPRRRVFGQELIECTLPYEFGARTNLTFNPGGVLCELEIPLETCVTSVEPVVQQLLARGGGH